jgi:hypothetical protein
MGLVRVNAAGRRIRHDMGDGVEPRADGANATAQPADSAWQGDVGTAQQIGGSLHAPGRTGGGDAVFDGIEQVRQSGGKKVRQQTERPMPLRTIPPGNAHSPGCQARIAAVASEGAAARRMQWTAAQLGGAPFTVPDVGLGARRGVQRHLHRRSPPHRRMAPRRRKLCGVRGAAVTGHDGVAGGPLRIKPNSG